MKETLKRILHEKDRLHALVSILNAQFSQKNKNAIQIWKEAEEARSAQRKLSKEVATLSKNLDEVKSSQTTLDDEKTVLHRQLKSERGRFTVESSRLKATHTTLSTDNDKLRLEIASETRAAGLLREELDSLKEEIFAVKQANEEAQATLHNFQTRNDELQASAVKKEEETSDLIAGLSNQISFFRSYPFKSLLLHIFGVLKLVVELEFCWNWWSLVLRRGTVIAHDEDVD